jgi:hypothetical protein
MIIQLQRRLNIELPELQPYFSAPPPRPPRVAPLPPIDENAAPSAPPPAVPQPSSDPVTQDTSEQPMNESTESVDLNKADDDDEYDESGDEETEEADVQEGGFEPIFRMIVTNDMATIERLVLRDTPGTPLTDFAKDTIFMVLEWNNENYDYFYNKEADRRRDHESMLKDESMASFMLPVSLICCSSCPCRNKYFFEFV